MDRNAFWEMIERSRTSSADPDARLEWLTERLAALPVTEIADFQIHLGQVRRRVDTWWIWGAAYLICDGLCSDDGFWYFQAWLVGLGREAFERVAANPDALAELPEVQRLAGGVASWSENDWPEWESLDYVADEAYERVTGEDEGLDDVLQALGRGRLSSPEPTDERWDFEDEQERTRRLPRLSTLFPLTDRTQRDGRNRAAFDRLLAERGQTEEEFFSDISGRPAQP
jgi:hypothetical protein